MYDGESKEELRERLGRIVRADETAMCPHCGWMDDVDCFDVGGADAGCVFCLNCHQEFEL